MGCLHFSRMSMICLGRPLRVDAMSRLHKRGLMWDSMPCAPLWAALVSSCSSPARFWFGAIEASRGLASGRFDSPRLSGFLIIDALQPVARPVVLIAPAFGREVAARLEKQGAWSPGEDCLARFELESPVRFFIAVFLVASLRGDERSCSSSGGKRH